MIIGSPSQEYKVTQIAQALLKINMAIKVNALDQRVGEEEVSEHSIRMVGMATVVMWET